MSLALHIFFMLCSFYVRQVFSTEERAPGTICPPSYMIEPCTCTDPSNKPVVLSCENITNHEKILEVFETADDYQFGSFVLRYSSVTFMPSKLLKMRLLKSLEIIKTSLDDLFDDTPPQQNSLEYILVNDGGKLMRTLSWKYFSPLSKLVNLILKSVNVGNLDKNFMNQVTKTVEYLGIEDGKIYELNDKCFSEFKSLRVLSLIKNHIKVLKRNMFHSPSNLTALWLRDNDIAFIPDDLFADMPEIKSVYLEGNILKTISKGVFDVMPNGATLLIHRNSIVCNCKMKWIIKAKQRSICVQGDCKEPKHLKGKNLEDFTEEDFSHCELDEYLQSLILLNKEEEAV